MTNEPKTLVKVGIFKGDLGEAVKNFSEELFYLPVGLKDNKKYALFKECENPYLLIVSQQKDIEETSLGYNSKLTVTSHSDQKNQEIAEKFERETNVKLDAPVPSDLKKYFELMNLTFPVFEEHPKEAMKFLSSF